MKSLIVMMAGLILIGCNAEITVSQSGTPTPSSMSALVVSTPNAPIPSPSPSPSYTPPAIVKIDPFTSSGKETMLLGGTDGKDSLGVIYISFPALYEYGRIDQDFTYVYSEKDAVSQSPYYSTYTNYGCVTSFIQVVDSLKNSEYPRITIRGINQSENPNFQTTYTYYKFVDYLRVGWQLWNYDSSDECHRTEGTWELRIKGDGYNEMVKI